MNEVSLFSNQPIMKYRKMLWCYVLGSPPPPTQDAIVTTRRGSRAKPSLSTGVPGCWVDPSYLGFWWGWNFPHSLLVLTDNYKGKKGGKHNGKGFAIPWIQGPASKLVGFCSRVVTFSGEMFCKEEFFFRGAANHQRSKKRVVFHEWLGDFAVARQGIAWRNVSCFIYERDLFQQPPKHFRGSIIFTMGHHEYLKVERNIPVENLFARKSFFICGC